MTAQQDKIAAPTEELPPHIIALNYVHGQGRRPTMPEMTRVNDSLYSTVLYVDELRAAMGKLEAQNESLRAESKKIRAEIATSARPLNVEPIGKTQEDVIGKGIPCGQVLRIAQPDGRYLYVTCIMAGMPVYDGKCHIHAPQTEKPHPSSVATTSAAPSVMAASVAPVGMSYVNAAKKTS